MGLIPQSRRLSTTPTSLIRPEHRAGLFRPAGRLAGSRRAFLGAAAGATLAAGLPRAAGAQDEEPVSQLDPEATGAPSLRPLIVQIDNDPRARNSMNLGAAQIVYEYTAEGGVTRFSAVYPGDWDTVGLIGNVRSGRLATIEIVQQFNAILAYHGGATGIQERIWNSWIDFISFELEENYPFFTRVNWRQAPYNSYSDLPRIRAAARQKGIPLLGRGLQSFPVGDYEPPWDTVRPINRIYIPYQPGFQVLYEWDHATQAYWRSMGGRTHFDDGYRAPITLQNVVVQFVPSFLTDIVEDIYGSRSLDYGLQGSGRALVFRNGMMIEATWHREEPWHFTAFYDDNGTNIPMNVGSTWVSLVEPGFPVDVWQEGT
jgi:hypothetical protein